MGLFRGASALLRLALNVPLWGQSKFTEEMTAPLTLIKSPSVSVSTLAGYRIRSYENEDLGTIEEIIIYPDSGRIAYAVLCFGGAYGFGDKLFAVPWNLLHLDAEDRVLVLSWDHSKLAAAPAFDQDDWPDFADESWEQEIREFYGSGAVKPAGA